MCQREIVCHSLESWARVLFENVKLKIYLRCLLQVVFFKNVNFTKIFLVSLLLIQSHCSVCQHNNNNCVLFNFSQRSILTVVGITFAIFFLKFCHNLTSNQTNFFTVFAHIYELNMVQNLASYDLPFSRKLQKTWHSGVTKKKTQYFNSLTSRDY